ncbi:ribbon-helix-helix domain-containing protein [Cupriavidus basilensis]
MKRTHTFIPDQTILRLRELSENTGLSVAELIRRAIDDYLKHFSKEAAQP